MRLPRSVVAMLVLIGLALVAALSLVGKATAEMAADTVTTLGSSADEEVSGSLLGALEGTCKPARSGIDALELGRFAPIDNGRLEELPAPLGSDSHPIELAIPAIDVDSRVIAVAQDSRHQIVVPTDISAVGWYEYGPAPGSTRGSCVMVSHRDGVGGGNGAFYDLGSLVLGDRITVTTQDGTRLTYAVTSRSMVSKEWFAQHSGEFFTSAGSPRLTLITCGGEYIKSQGGYQSNIIVTARPVPK
jgi:sortase (surface protein transpeptidase)